MFFLFLSGFQLITNSLVLPNFFTTNLNFEAKEKSISFDT